MLKARRDADAGGAELAVYRASARRLDRDAVIGPATQQVEPWEGVVGGVEHALAQSAVARLHPAGAEIFDQLRPGALGAVGHDGIGMRRGLVRHQRDMQPAEDNGNPQGPVSVGERIGRVDAGREGRDAHQIEALQRVFVWERVVFDILHFDVRRR